MKNKINLLLATTIWMVVFSNNLSASIIIGNAYIDSEKDTIVTNDNIIGLIRYEAATRTITLQDASITMPYSLPMKMGGIRVSDEDTVIINLVGNNTITGIVPIEIQHTVCHIMGTGKLVLNAPYEDSWGGIFYWALYPWYENANGLILSGGCQVEIYAPHSVGIYTRRNPHFPDTHEDRCVIRVESSSLMVDAGESAIWHARELILSDCHIEEPANAYFNADSGVVLDNTGMVSNFLRICPGTSKTPEQDTDTYRIFGSKGGIYLQGIPNNTTVQIFSISGQRIRILKTTQSNMYIPLKSGMYIVDFDNYRKKVIVL